MNTPLNFIRTALKMWVHSSKPVTRIEQILDECLRKSGAPCIDPTSTGGPYHPIEDPGTRLALLAEVR